MNNRDIFSIKAGRLHNFEAAYDPCGFFDLGLIFRANFDICDFSCSRNNKLHIGSAGTAMSFRDIGISLDVVDEPKSKTFFSIFKIVTGSNDWRGVNSRKAIGLFLRVEILKQK